MVECAYSGREINKTEGIMLVRNNGERLYFASSKELKNWKQDRNHDYRDSE
jgi:ribosomal protein L24E